MFNARRIDEQEWMISLEVTGPRREFHVSRESRDRYEFEERVFSVQGHVLFGNIHAAREFAHKINVYRDAVEYPERAVYASEIYGMGFLDEVQHMLIARYFEQHGQSLRGKLRTAVEAAVGPEALEQLLLAFSEKFPTVRHYRGEETARESLDRTVGGIDGRDVAIEELIVLWLANKNLAYEPARELFAEDSLRDSVPGEAYDQFLDAMSRFFEDEAPVVSQGSGWSDRKPGAAAPPSSAASDDGPEMSLLEALREPARAHPESIAHQLDFVQAHFGSFLGDGFDRLLRAVDLLQEEHRPRFSGPGETPVPTFSADEEQARFSTDRDWMPRVILLAKSTLVWLDQLSKSYGFEIRTLDAVPDAELDAIASNGFTGLWLIGLWERSNASRRIKQLMGNAEAAASAYSLYDYEIAEELGGWEAVGRLRHRLWERGVRLASDMVPNHTGIDGRWVYEHPDWFVQLDRSPFPGYRFSGEDLSSRKDVGIYLEDHYFEKTDAAVVFKRVNHGTGRERYIYHGNDGTSMPWNDTAQLDFLHAEAREAVIQTILHVARNFPIIRFDAAMTLAKKHIQRLWHPKVGQGGDIASRSEHGMSPEEFEKALPTEFWREVVDRVAAEVPDTLLLAEAFWMMEGYFVRALGMHRVYNSAFMNMLKDEENEKYRQTVKNTLEFDPQILKRFVNFMNNPDEETAVEQFGKGEKYLGVTTLMITMPGLPMFGHGQVEGFTEKYGMEYRRAYRDEIPDQWLLDQHRRYIFPLMHKRYLFADVEHFRLFDVVDHQGNVNEDVFAYTNRHGQESTLVLYNNSMNETRGKLTLSVPFSVADDAEDADNPRTQRDTLAEALGLTNSYNHFTVLKETNSSHWYVRNSAELHRDGLHVHLRGYERQVFTDVQEVADTENAHYARIADQLRGGGTPDLLYTLKRLDLQPLLDAFAGVANSGTFREIRELLLPGEADSEPRDTARAASSSKTGRQSAVPPNGRSGSDGHQAPRGRIAATTADREVRWKRIIDRYRGFLHIAAEFVDQPVTLDDALAAVERNGDGLRRLVTFSGGRTNLAKMVNRFLKGDGAWLLVSLALLQPLEELLSSSSELPLGRLLDDWMLPEEVARVIAAIEATDQGLIGDRRLLGVLGDHIHWFSQTVSAQTLVDSLLQSERAAAYVGVNRYNDILWYTGEQMEILTDALVACGVWRELSATEDLPKKTTDRLSTIHKTIQTAQGASEYQVEKLRRAVARPGKRPDPA